LASPATEDGPDVIARLVNPDYTGHPERVIVFDVEAWNANYPQHITPRFTEEEIASTGQALRDRIAELEAENIV
jgi:hypothetical protein